MSDPLLDPSDEAAAWAEVEARWDDPAAHTAYLARFHDLEGLARAGQRYREVLTRRPDDAVAKARRDEVVKRATVVGLSSLPRTAPSETPRWVRRAIQLGAASFGSAAAWAIYKFAVVLLREHP